MTVNLNRLVNLQHLLQMPGVDHVWHVRKMLKCCDEAACQPVQKSV